VPTIERLATSLVVSGKTLAWSAQSTWPDCKSLCRSRVTLAWHCFLRVSAELSPESLHLTVIRRSSSPRHEDCALLLAWTRLPSCGLLPFLLVLLLLSDLLQTNISARVLGVSNTLERAIYRRRFRAYGHTAWPAYGAKKGPSPSRTWICSMSLFSAV
jgi:hypothetical protein